VLIAFVVHKLWPKNKSVNPIINYRYLLMSDVISELGFWPFWLRLPDEGPILPKFSLETKLESESFEPMIDFLAFLIHELWPKIKQND